MVLSPSISDLRQQSYPVKSPPQPVKVQPASAIAAMVLIRYRSMVCPPTDGVTVPPVPTEHLRLRYNYSWVKVAVMVLSPSMHDLVAVVPVESPPQPVKVQPASAGRRDWSLRFPSHMYDPQME